MWLSAFRSARTPGVVHLYSTATVLRSRVALAFSLSKNARCNSSVIQRSQSCVHVWLSPSRSARTPGVVRLYSTVTALRSRVALAFSISKNTRCSSPVVQRSQSCLYVWLSPSRSARTLGVVHLLFNCCFSFCWI